MNLLRTMGPILAVCAIVFVGNANADASFVNQAFIFAVTKTHDSKFLIAGTFLADHAEDSIIGKAAVETAGYALDMSKGDLSKVDPEEVGKHFILNYGIRRASTELTKRGYSLDPLASACDQLPIGVKDVVSPLVTNVVQVATHPETLTIASLYVLNNVVIPYLESNNK